MKNNTKFDANSFGYCLTINMQKRDEPTDWYNAIDLVNNHYNELCQTVLFTIRKIFKNKKRNFFDYLLVDYDNTADFYVSLYNAYSKLELNLI